MVKKEFLYLFLMISLFSTGCSTISHELYTGRDLKIGVIGDAPKVAETIFFADMTFEELEKDRMTVHSQHDAIFIMPEKLTEADAEKFVEVYKQLRIPIFFIGTTKAAIPFTFEDASYSKVADVSPKSYAAGYLYNPDNQLGQQWRFIKEKEDNEKITEKEIKKIYSEIFNTISSIN
ncbi:hypothetical protein [Carnobacterium sp. TMP28]|uniref:hypothetical protein n=1 Tax=Carnobacterium sp. TMP28 TaxID=3397060 RepID=UPI0039DF3556